MVEGTITKLDMESRMVVVEDGTGREITVRIPEDTIVEVVEPETMGTQAGEMKDLEVGYLVTLELDHPDTQGVCACASICCIS